MIIKDIAIIALILVCLALLYIIFFIKCHPVIVITDNEEKFVVAMAPGFVEVQVEKLPKPEEFKWE